MVLSALFLAFKSSPRIVRHNRNPSKSDDLCEQLAIFGPGSAQRHQEALGDARSSDAFVHWKATICTSRWPFSGQKARRATRTRQETPGEARRSQERPREARRRQEGTGEARRRQERPGEARRRQEKPRHKGRPTTQGKAHDTRGTHDKGRNNKKQEENKKKRRRTDKGEDLEK